MQRNVLYKSIAEVIALKGKYKKFDVQKRWRSTAVGGQSIMVFKITTLSKAWSHEYSVASHYRQL